MDLINDFLYQIVKNTTLEFKINIPINIPGLPNSTSFNNEPSRFFNANSNMNSNAASDANSNMNSNAASDANSAASDANSNMNSNAASDANSNVNVASDPTGANDASGGELKSKLSQGPSGSQDLLRLFFENLASPSAQVSQTVPLQTNDNIYTLISQLELVISTLRKILTGMKTQQNNTDSRSNSHYLLDNYIEMLENTDKILKSFKLIRSSFSF